MIVASTGVQREGGYLTVATLTGLAFLGIITLLAWRCVSATLAAITTAAEGERAYHRAVRNGAAAFPRIPSGTSPKNAVFLGVGIAGKTTVGVRIEALENNPTEALTLAVLDGTAPGAPSFPTIDLDTLLAASPPCIDVIPATPETLSSGRPRSVGSLAAIHTCRFPASIALPGLTARENILITGPTTLGGVDPAQTITLATPGSFEASGALVVSPQTLIVAGGDLVVTSLTAAEPSAVTVVSATGIVSVEQISPHVRIRALGYRGVALPPGTSQVGATPLPPVIPHLLLGVRRGGR